MVWRKVKMDQKVVYRLAYLHREERLLLLFLRFAQMPLTKTTHLWWYRTYLRRWPRKKFKLKYTPFRSFNMYQKSFRRTLRGLPIILVDMATRKASCGVLAGAWRTLSTSTLFGQQHLFNWSKDTKFSLQEFSKTSVQNSLAQQAVVRGIRPWQDRSLTGQAAACTRLEK